MVDKKAVDFAAAIAGGAAWGRRVLLLQRLALPVDSAATRPAHARVVAARTSLVAAKHGELDCESLFAANGAVAHEGFYKRRTTQPGSFYAQRARTLRSVARAIIPRSRFMRSAIKDMGVQSVRPMALGMLHQ